MLSHFHRPRRHYKDAGGAWEYCFYRTANSGGRRSASEAAEEHTEAHESETPVQSHACGLRRDGLLASCLQRANYDMTRIDVEDWIASQRFEVAELISVMQK
jgi:hypothetical protein